MFDPVELEGTTVSRASVHNLSIVRELALGTGDTIKVYKANMIIPQIAENLTRSGVRDIPQNCPVDELDLCVILGNLFDNALEGQAGSVTLCMKSVPQ